MANALLRIRMMLTVEDLRDWLLSVCMGFVDAE